MIKQLYMITPKEQQQIQEIILFEFKGNEVSIKLINENFRSVIKVFK